MKNEKGCEIIGGERRKEAKGLGKEGREVKKEEYTRREIK